MLWAYLGETEKDEIALSFEEIGQICGVPVDHSFLRYKHELTEYGYTVKKICMKETRIVFERTQKSDKSVLYVHGMGGSAEEALHYKQLFPDCKVTGLDYKASTPWEAEIEFPAAIKTLCDKCNSIILIANSIGAYFSMLALPQEKIEKAFFISPVVSMENIIRNMMERSDITATELQKKKVIETAYGETLSWDYLSYSLGHPIQWNVPTEILYGENDNMTSFETVTDFANTHHAGLTVIKNGEHWFHTSEQMDFLDNWIKLNMQ